MDVDDLREMVCASRDWTGFGWRDNQALQERAWKTTASEWEELTEGLVDLPATPSSRSTDHQGKEQDNQRATAGLR